MGLSFSHIRLLPNVFSTEAYLSLHKSPVIEKEGSDWLSFYPEEGTTQYKAPILQGEFSLREAGVRQLLNRASTELGKSRWKILLPPLLPSLIELTDLQMNADEDDFQLLHSDTNYHLDLTQPFQDNLPGDQRRLLQKQRRLRYVAEQVGPSHLAKVYTLLNQNRSWKGYPLTISEPELQAAFHALPDSYRGYLCYAPGNKIVGAAIVVLVNAEVWYTYLLGHLPVTGASPVLSLIDAIQYDAAAAGAGILDLGTAGSEGMELPGLAAFKRSLGAKTTPKMTLLYQVPNLQLAHP